MTDEIGESREQTEEDSFNLSGDELAILKRFALELRSRLVKADPQFIRSSAPAILAIERLPKPTPGVQVTFGYRTPNTDGNHGWADIVLTEHEIEASVGEHFYDPGVGGDTETSTLFWTGAGQGPGRGSLEEWFERASGTAIAGDLFLSDESEAELIDWETK